MLVCFLLALLVVLTRNFLCLSDISETALPAASFRRVFHFIQNQVGRHPRLPSFKKGVEQKKKKRLPRLLLLLLLMKFLILFMSFGCLLTK